MNLALRRRVRAWRDGTWVSRKVSHMMRTLGFPSIYVRQLWASNRCRQLHRDNYPPSKSCPTYLWGIGLTHYCSSVGYRTISIKITKTFTCTRIACLMGGVLCEKVIIVKNGISHTGSNRGGSTWKQLNSFHQLIF